MNIITFLLISLSPFIFDPDISLADYQPAVSELSGNIIMEKPGSLISDSHNGNDLYSSNTQDSQILFNGVSLDGWEIVDFTGHGTITVSDNCVIIGKGLGISGIRWIKDIPKTNYEVSLEAKRIEGDDFFCGLTFPVKESFCTFVVGGWGGSIVGLSSIDDEVAANNITYDFRNFELNQWYKIRVKVTDEKIEAWIDNDNIVDFIIGNHRISLRWEAESSIPLGIVTWQTTAAIRNIKLN